MQKPVPRRKSLDGFFNVTAGPGQLPTLEEGQSQQTTAWPAGPSLGDYESYQDPIFEVDYMSLECRLLEQYIEKLSGVGRTVRSEAALAYYQGKLNMATSAYNAKCKLVSSGGSGSGNNGGTGGGSTGTGSGSGTGTGTGNSSVTTTMPGGGNTDINTMLSGNASGAGGGAGGGGSTTTTDKKKIPNWLWLLVAAGLVILAVSQDKSK